jgi:hypothetical protein
MTLPHTDNPGIKVVTGLTLSPLYWLEKKNLLAPDEKKLIDIVARMPNRMPPDFQCPKLLEIRARMAAEGFECSK